MSILNATQWRAVALRSAVMVATAAGVAAVLPPDSPGNLGGVAAFLILTICAWHVGPVPAAFGPLVLAVAWGLLHQPAANLLRDLTAEQWSSLIVITIVLTTVGWAGMLRRRSQSLASRQAEQLREQDARKDQFLAVLAHELRNPLAPIRSGLELLRPGSDGSLDPQTVREVHGIMQRQVDHLVDLVNELLDISRINTGKIELRREPTVLNAIVRDAVHSTQPDLDAARHHLSVELPDQSPIVHADAKRILQVLTNLLKNAAKFTEPGGHIAVSVAGDDQSVEVRVRDTGVGIPAGMLPRVFEMFSQVEDQLTRRHGGLGIGLSLAQSLVQLHGGTIEARSEGPGKGSEFILRLPTAAVSPEQSRQREAVDVPLVCEPQCIRVLVVDDNADAANNLLMVLSARGYDCQAAYDGETALKLAEAFQPRIFVLDIGMPGMSGYELARRLRSAPQFERATFVAVTGWGQEQDRRQSREAGFDHHFAKPVSVMALERVLTAASSNGEPELHAHAVPSGLARTAV